MSRNAQPSTQPGAHSAIAPLADFLFCLCLGLALLIPPQACAQTPLPSDSASENSARVIIAEDAQATESLQPVPERIQILIDRAITNLTGKTTVSNAWRSLVSTQDTVGLKVLSAPGANSGTRPVVVAAIVEDLLAAGLLPDHIIVWDKRSADLRLAGFYGLRERFGIRVMGSADAGYDEKTFYDTALLGPMSWSDLEFAHTGPGVGRKSYVSKLVSKEMTKIINVTPLIHNNITGVSGNLYSLAMGGVDNTLRFQGEPDSMARAVPEIYALPILGDRVVLNIVDALVCQYQGQDRGMLQYSAILNQLRFSRDPVALDVLSLEEINRQRELAGVPLVANVSDLFSNASLLEIGVSDPRHIQVDKLP